MASTIWVRTGCDVQSSVRLRTGWVSIPERSAQRPADRQARNTLMSCGLAYPTRRPLLAGRQSDAQGNLAQWWSAGTLQTYLRKAQCIVQQYDSYRVPELDGLLGSAATVSVDTPRAMHLLYSKHPRWRLPILRLFWI